ncbi:MAG: SpoIVB peptidase [Lachnospiraceae bacterium]|jgi:stage IV sporulation protein B|nr:SpoIVB peptidase [Lachnospiraceae bacterium]
MKRKKIYRSILIVAFLLTLAGMCVYYISYVNNSLPEHIHILVNSEEEFDFSLPFTGEADVTQVGAVNLNKKLVEGEKIRMDFSHPFTIKADQTGDVTIALRLFGIIPLREVSMKVVEEQEVIPCGVTVGIYVETDGLLVLGTGEVTDRQGGVQEPALNIVKSGDYILSANETKVTTTRELQKAIENCGGEDVVLAIRRNGEESEVRVHPIEDAQGSYKAGIWVRDSTQGIGTLTFLDMRERYGALGHGITDVDTGLLLEIEKGYLYRANVLTITKGVPGTPGELVGVINKAEDARLGMIESNTNHGINGELTSEAVSELWGESVPTALRQDVKLGTAWVRSCISGQPEDYEIEIEQIENGRLENGRGMVIRITDERLLELTGGIVQGMSGSPILQDGKLIGAVTHVFVKDSTRGYATFIESMLE